MFDRNLNPYSDCGRWYKFFIESDADGVVLTTSDLEGVTVEGSYLKFPEGYHILKRAYDINTVAGAAANVAIDLHIFADGTQGIQLPSITTFDYADIYVFAHNTLTEE